MKHRRAVIFALVGLSLGCLAAISAARYQESWNSAGSRNEDAVLRHLRPMLESAGKSGRLYYRGTCKEQGWDPIQFPSVSVSPPRKGEADIAAIQDMFRADKEIEVSEEPLGLIRIRIGQVSHSMLETNISILNLKPMEQYNAAEAINAIENASDVIKVMHERGIEAVPIFLGLEVTPTRKEPHLPPSISNTTVDRVLDMIATTFKGVVVYGECPRTGAVQQFYIGFAGVRGFDNPTQPD